MIPKAYKDHLYSFAGDKSVQWLEEMEGNLNYAISKWSLRNVKPMALSYNLVVSADSDNGPLVLKCCLPGNEFLTEVNALQELNASMMVETIDVDLERRLILLKKLSPGHTLWDLPYNERLKVAAPLLESVPSLNYKKDYPEHRHWLIRIAAYVKKHFRTHEMNDHLDYLIENYDLISDENNPVVLLHGDLHHGNILKNDHWTVIDPKGATGYKSLEVGRYMNNQIGEAGIEIEACMKEMVEAFSKAFNLSEGIILRSFYADMVLSTSWFFEDHVLDEDAINKKLDIIKMIRNRL